MTADPRGFHRPTHMKPDNRFKVGDRVAYTSHPGAPIPELRGKQGEVIEHHPWDHYTYRVKWDNGLTIPMMKLEVTPIQSANEEGKLF